MLFISRQNVKFSSPEQYFSLSIVFRRIKRRFIGRNLFTTIIIILNVYGEGRINAIVVIGGGGMAERCNRIREALNLKKIKNKPKIYIARIIFNSFRRPL